MAANIVLPACDDSDANYNRELAALFSLTYPQPCTTLIHSPNIGGVSCLGMSMCERDERDDVSKGICHYEPRIFEMYPVTQFFNIDGYIRNDLVYHQIELDR